MISREIEKRLRQAVLAVIPDADPAVVQLRPCPDPKFGDYQASAVMALAKQRKANPRQIAADVVANLDVNDLCEPVEIAGPGFLNFRISKNALNAEINKLTIADSLIEQTNSPRTVVVDFSSPNVAKPMHVGHIRSTGIGDAIQRILRLLGHRVITDNHIGDWGTQFGKLLVGWKTQLDRTALEKDPIAEMERLYKTINDASETDEAVLAGSREELVKLQSGDEENLAIWREMIELSQHQFDDIYGRLNVRFDHTNGESFYNDQLKGVVDELVANGLAKESRGALCVFSGGNEKPGKDPFLIKNKGEWIPDPAIVRKSDGGFNYMTSDLATIDYRVKEWNADEIVYVVDDRQSSHFKKLFNIFARWKPEAAKKLKLVHVGFGKILGDNGKPFKTRSGDTVRLADLLNEAEERALKVVTEKNKDLALDVRKEVARVVGIGAIKYADLAPNRQSDYIFNWDKMLAFQGDTAPYLQYAYTRIRSIFRKSEEDGVVTEEQPIRLTEDDEIALAKHLLRFSMVLESVVEDYRPNYLCQYLYELAGHYSRFYESCPVLKSEGSVRSHRLKLCELAGRVMKTGLNALGIETLEQM